MARYTTYCVTVTAILLILICNGALAQVFDCPCNAEDNTINCSSRLLKIFGMKLPPDCEYYNKIDLSSNAFTTIPYAEMSQFKVINISNNLISILDSPSGMDVNVLNVSWNKIEKLTLKATLRNVNELYAAHNELKGEFLSGTCNLIILDVSNNNITSLSTVNSCNKLSLLDASQNDIQFIPDNFKTLHNLEMLDLSDNKLQSLSNLPKALKHLTLPGNKLSEIIKASFTGLSALEELNLANNEIWKVTDDAVVELMALKTVDLSNNSLSSVPHLNVSDSLRELSLVNNSIVKMTRDDVEAVFSLLNEERRIDLRNNSLHGDDDGLRALVLRLDADNATVEVSPDSACINATRGAAVLFLCVVEGNVHNRSWVDIARETTTTTTTTPASNGQAENENVENVPASISGSVTSPSEAMKTNETDEDEQKINAQDITFASHYMNAMGAAKLSFVAFLLLTLMILIIINCIVGPPVVDERWWEEKLPGDRIVS